MDSELNQPRFASLAEAVEAFTALEAEASSGQTLLNEAGEQIASLTAELSAANDLAQSQKARIDELEKVTADSESAITDLKNTIATLEANAMTVERRAAQMAASVGVDPVSHVPQGGGQGEMSRADFDKLGLNERMQFFRNGGKLI